MSTSRLSRCRVDIATLYIYMFIESTDVMKLLVLPLLTTVLAPTLSLQVLAIYDKLQVQISMPR